MLSSIKKECLTYKAQCEDLIPRCEESQPTLLHCKIRAEKICASLDELEEDEARQQEKRQQQNRQQQNQQQQNQHFVISIEEQIDILKAFVFVILDFTFFVENDLAEKNFASAKAKSAIYQVLEDLDKPRVIYESHVAAGADAESAAEAPVAAQASNNDDADSGNDSSKSSPWPSFDEAVGNDLAECLYWRKGALIYMYHSATEGRLATEPNKPELARLMKCGVDNLKKMLSVRQEFKVIDNDAFVHDEGNTLQLIQRGLFSDTHVLALMYAGEMCYWFVKWVGEESNFGEGRNDSGDPSPTSTSSSTTNASSSTTSPIESPLPRHTFRSIGIELLTRYKEAVAGPLKSGGWSAEKAQEILDFLQS